MKRLSEPHRAMAPGILTDLHRFNADQLLYPLLLSSLFTCALYAARPFLVHRQAYPFLGWNLFLAWIPYLCSWTIALLYPRLERGKWLLLAPAALWLIFLPNAPYVVTDLTYLPGNRSLLWYDTFMFAAYLWTGLLLGIASLNAMHRLVAASHGRVAGWLFVLGTCGLTGLGIYFGRFLAWNSWDPLLYPRSFLRSSVQALSDPIGYWEPYSVTLLSGALFLICYLTFVSVARREKRSMDGAE